MSDSALREQILRSHPRNLRRRVWTKTDGLCWYCGEGLDQLGSFEMDHSVPKRLGGRTDFANLVPCCRNCNQLKHGRGIDEFRELIAVKRGWRFSPEQTQYLNECGIELPEPRRHEFFGERWS